MNIINFSYNWNNKLDCKAFTTLRLRNDDKYKVGFNYSIALNNIPMFEALIQDVKHFKIDAINEFVARLDTGYNREECINIIKKMYPKVDFEKQQLSLILLVKQR